MTAKTSRLELIDGLRGLAVAMMIAYHFCYDLTWFGWAQWRLLYDPAWIAWRSAIVTLFLFLVGVSLALRELNQVKPQHFWKRWAHIAAAALLVSLGSWLFAGDRFIYFGILHLVALALLLGSLCAALGRWNAVLGLLIVVIGLSVHSDMFNPKLWNWLGFASIKPATEDYAPLFPWFGIVLIGMALGQTWIQRGLPGAHYRLPRVLCWLGRWSLTVYLTHQMILIGMLWVIQSLIQRLMS
jgi:uncharacterized membrane protein